MHGLKRIDKCFHVHCRKIWVAREMNRWGIWGLFEIMQMVPSSCTKLQVILAPLRRFQDKNITECGVLRKFPQNR